MAWSLQDRSPLGYLRDGNIIDSYGVNHSRFSTRDELQYQTARVNRENELINRMERQGIKEYPQYTTDFWGRSKDNNYGFGDTDIEDNIEKMKQKPDFWDAAKESLQHDAEDMLYGVKKGLSGATLGASDWALRKMGITDDDYLARREAEGLGTAVKSAGFVSELGGNILGAGGAIVKGLGKAGLKGLGLASAAGGIEGLVYGATDSNTLSEVPMNMFKRGVAGAVTPPILYGGAVAGKWVAKSLTDRVTRYIGNRRLAKQLRKSADFEDVSLGNVNDELATRLNQVRNAENVSPVENSRVTVPADRVEHITQRRIVDNKYSPQDTADVVNSALFGKNIRVMKGNVPENQVIFDTSNLANKVVVSKSDKTNGISVITAMKDKRLGRVNERLGGLPFPPYGASITSDASTAADSFKIPDFQPLKNNIIQEVENVNPIFKRSFVEALADEEKIRTMRNAVLSGADDLSERAKILSDKMTARKNGMYDAAFEDVITIPELKRAKEAYRRFMDKNGETVLPQNAVNEFYNKNSIAHGMVDKAREINPSAFEGIKPGSLSEFDELKRLLNAESKNIMSGASAGTKDAYKRASNSLKYLMDNSASGFKDINTKIAAAETAQDIFESKLSKGLMQVGGSTAVTSPFWSGISSPLTVAGIVGGAFNPASLALTVGGLGGKAVWRYLRRKAGRNLADGIIRTPIKVNINPALSAGLSATAYDAG